MTDEEKVYACANQLVEFEPIIAKGSRKELKELLLELRDIIQARDYSYIKIGAKLYWQDPADETSSMCKVEEIYIDDDADGIEDDTMILISYNGSEAEVNACELYLKTKEICPFCGRRMFKSDLAHYKYVCLHCDENFD